MDFVRTPDARFERLLDYPFKPHYEDIDNLRMHYVDEGPATRNLERRPLPAGRFASSLCPGDKRPTCLCARKLICLINLSKRAALLFCLTRSEEHTSELQ